MTLPNNMSEKTLRERLAIAVNQANKRYDRLKASGLLSPALRAADLSGGRFTAKQDSVEGMYREYCRAMNYMSLSTSCLAGAKAFEESTVDVIPHLDIGIDDFKAIMSGVAECDIDFEAVVKEAAAKVKEACDSIMQD